MLTHLFLLLAVLQSETERCGHLRKTINMLPPKHRDCLEFLMFHLARVASRERENLVGFDSAPEHLAWNHHD